LTAIFIPWQCEGRLEANPLGSVQFLNPGGQENLPPQNSNQTRRRLLGRTPLCGIGVTSRIDVIVKPTA
jgi:hypothetical protein